MAYNMEKILPLFTLISGQGEEYLPLIKAAALEVEGRIKAGADREDERLEFLIAAIANRGYAELDSAKLKPYAAVVGDLSAKTASDYRCRSAQNLVDSYTALCRELLLDDGFFFYTTGQQQAVTLAGGV